MCGGAGGGVLDVRANRAARLLGIDYVDTVTGFDFKGRHGTPVVRGVVVATEYQPAVAAVIQGLHEEEAHSEASAQKIECLRLWKRFLAVLRVHARISDYDIEGGNCEGDLLAEDLRRIGEKHRQSRLIEGRKKIDGDEDDSVEAGGFFFDPEAHEVAQPTSTRFPRDVDHRDHDQPSAGGFMLEKEDDGDVNEAMREYLQAEETTTRRCSTNFNILDVFNTDANESSSASGGGFLPDSASPSKEENKVEKEEVEAAIGNITANSHRQSNRGIAQASENLIYIPHDGADRGKYSLVGKKFGPESADLEEEDKREVDDRDCIAHHRHLHHRSPLLDRDDDDHHHHEKVKRAGEEEEEENKNDEANDDETDELASLISHDPDDDDAEPEWLVSD